MQRATVNGDRAVASSYHGKPCIYELSCTQYTIIPYVRFSREVLVKPPSTPSTFLAVYRGC